VPNAGWSQFQNASLPIVAREFFHTWTERKIQSSQMSTIDYTTPIKTNSLWLTDGITDYYAKLLPARYGFASPASFYNSIQSWYDMLEQEGNDLSLEQLSAEAGSNDLERSRLFLSKAPLVALMLDIEIREKTKNRRSLDDVLLSLYKNSRNGRTYNDKELIKTVEKTVGVDLAEFYSKFIAGDEALPLEDYLNKMGAASDLPEGLRPQADIGFDIALTNAGSVIVKNVRDNSSGVQKGDTISKINDIVLDGKNLTAVLSNFKNGDKVKVTVVKNKKNQDVAAVAKSKEAPKRTEKLKVAPAKKPSSSQLAMRNGIVGKRKLASLSKSSK
jgi:predicted metalloprotease with PDZ domain